MSQGRQVAKIFITRRVGRTLALAGIFLGSIAYQSDVHRPVFGRYSVHYAVLLAILGALVAGAVIWSIAAPRRADDVGNGGLLLELSGATWGIAYFASAVSDPGYGARLLVLNFIGSPFPASALFEYLTLCLLFTALTIGVARRARGRAANWGLVAITFLGLLLMGEGASRLAAFIGSRTHGIPSYSDFVFNRRYVRLNPEGFRDAEHRIERDPDSRRLLLVGDSFVFGAGLRDTSERFGNQLESALTGGSGADWEVINYGLGNKHTLEEIGFLRRGLRYHPDVVLLLYVFNDADYLRIRRPASPVAGARSRTTQPVDDETAIFGSPETLQGLIRPDRVLYWNSYLFQELYVRWRHLKLKRLPDDQSVSTLDVYRTPAVLARHLADLERFVQIADSAHVRVWIVPIDLGVPTVPDLTDRYRTFLQATRETGLPVLSLAEVYAGQRLDDLVVNTFDAHPNALGVRLAVEAIAPRILRAMEDSSESARPAR